MNIKLILLNKLKPKMKIYIKLLVILNKDLKFLMNENRKKNIHKFY